MDASGNLFGTTREGGKTRSCCGTVFELASGSRTESVLYDFCSKANCSDGDTPSDDPLILDASGDLFGSTYYGGTHVEDYSGQRAGTVFELTPN